VPPPVALKPTPVVVSMSSPPPVKLIVAPVLLLRVTAALPELFKALLVPLKFTVPPLQAETLMPVPVETFWERVPFSVSVPPVRL